MKESVECLSVSKKQSVREVLSRSYVVREHCAVCRLGEAAVTPPEFVIEVELGEERASACLGDSFLRAAAALELVVRGRVTPFTLQDVIDDMGEIGEILALF